MPAARTVTAWLIVASWLAWAVMRLGGLERGYPLMPLLALTPYAAAAALLSAGAFNATLDHAEQRRLIGTGHEDAAEQMGAGLRPTWPVGGRRRLPVTIDHVLADARAGVRAVATHRLANTDHRAFFAELVLPAE